MSNLEQEIMLGLVTDETLYEAEQTLSAEEFQRYSFMADTQKKSDVVAWLLWIFLGQFQVHMLYLNVFNERHQRVLRIVGLVLLYFVIGWIIILPLWIYDAIKMSSYIKEANNMEKAKILNMFLSKNKTQEPVNAGVVEKAVVTEQTVNTEAPVAPKPDVEMVTPEVVEATPVEEPIINEEAIFVEKPDVEMITPEAAKAEVIDAEVIEAEAIEQEEKNK